VAGAGGVGKTRLASEVAREVAGRFADGAWLVELGPVRDGSNVPAAVAAALRLPPPGPPAITAPSLAGLLARRQLLLVLDNCEHVLAAAAELCRALLLAADDVRVLATSRTPLGVSGEVRYRLPPFARPGPGDAADGAAVALFADRASQVDPHFRLDDRTSPLVRQIVTRLDGMPLAIELAAARVEALGLDQLVARLDGGLGLLVSGDRSAVPRHRSLAATVDWSYRLLDGLQQRVFRRLAVFPGPFTLDSAMAIAGADAGFAVLNLVDCSLITAPRTGPDGRARYVMLETLRAFGRDRLSEAGEEPATASALAQHALAIAEEAAVAMQLSGGELAAGRWLDAEDAALRQALAWSLEHDHGTALRLAVALTRWWIERGRSAEIYPLLSAAAGHAAPGSASWSAAQYWLGQSASCNCELTTALDHYTAASQQLAKGPPSTLLALALAGQANLLNLTGRAGDGATVAARALSLAREVGDRCAEVFAVLDLAQAVHLNGDLAGAVDWARQAGRIDPAALPGDFARDCNTILAMMLTEAGDLAAARSRCITLLELARQAGAVPAEAVGLYLLADLETRAGQLADAWRHLRPAVELAVRMRHRVQILVCLSTGADLCAAAGRWADVITIYAARRAAFAAGGEVADTPYRIDCCAKWTRGAARRLDPGQLGKADDRGAAMALETAADFLLLSAGPDQPAPDAADSAADRQELSPRERELVGLVARGRTDAQIAGQLHISLSTVRSHMDRIRDKTNCRRRADLTRLALHAGLA
jgi:predicted ATPase/DNA-binding CsgD family transcriptional regulator